ncbi:hypothetical protein ABMA58_04945 [Oceanospirillum sp. HFRX-1_2]
MGRFTKRPDLTGQNVPEGYKTNQQNRAKQNQALFVFETSGLALAPARDGKPEKMNALGNPTSKAGHSNNKKTLPSRVSALLCSSNASETNRDWVSEITTAGRDNSG